MSGDQGAEAARVTYILLARYKLPRNIALLDTLPRTGSGNVINAELRALLQALA